MDRTFLYHKTCPDGKIFTDEAEYKQALASGWVEAPWMIPEQGNSKGEDNEETSLSEDQAPDGSEIKRKKRGINIGD